jgi:diguanylate cyclase (GGDEF)-like protein
VSLTVELTAIGDDHVSIHSALNISPAWRSKAVAAVVLLLSVATIATITVLQQRSATSRGAELKLGEINDALSSLQSDPFRAMPLVGGSPALARRLVKEDQRSITETLAELERHGPPPALRELSAPLRANFEAIDQILPIGSSPTFTTGPDKRQLFTRLKSAGATREAAVALLAQAGREYRARATRAQAQATVGSATAILLLFLGFAFVYRRAFRARSVAERLAAENARLAAANRDDARTDALTGLRNRRALVDDLASELPVAGGRRELVVALFDLDGFKQYNDTFGHPAGDRLLARLGGQLQSALGGVGTAYRMGGDEFCVLVPDDPDGAASIVRLAADALSERGEAFEVGCSYGTALMPREASSQEEALRLADQRMYEHKAGRSSASRQSSDVLLKVLSERNADLREHLTGVSALASCTAERLGLPDHEVTRIGLAAELHDVGKTAIPDAILNKPGPLDEQEWDFMRRHTVIGERIILAAPSLAPTAELVRSSHEAFDGSGYPDALRGEAIPLGARIIAVCDAFDAMTSKRAYRGAMPTEDAIAELRRCAGRQFDPDIIEVFCALVEDGDLPPLHASADVTSPEPVFT